MNKKIMETIKTKQGTGNKYECSFQSDKLDFMSSVMDNLEELKTEQEIDLRTEQMMSIIKQANLMAKYYLSAGIL